MSGFGIGFASSLSFSVPQAKPPAGVRALEVARAPGWGLGSSCHLFLGAAGEAAGRRGRAGGGKGAPVDNWVRSANKAPRATADGLCLLSCLQHLNVP